MDTPLKKLVWMDLEMTGLDPARDRIIEIATVITDVSLQVIAQGPQIAIQTPQAALDAMDAWCTNTHTKSGLVGRVQASHLDIKGAEAVTLEFLRYYVKKEESPLCGNSIGTDRTFLQRQMPELEAWMHYRNLDVTVVRMLRGMWGRAQIPSFKKERTHKALDDIYDSIGELKHYRQFLFDPLQSKE